MNVVFLRSNPIAPDPRVEKEARVLHNNGFNVVVVGWDREDIFEKVEERDFGKIYRLKIKAKFGTGIKNIRHLIRWNIALLVWLFQNRKNYQFIHACDFDTVIPALISKILKKKKVIYDIFDFYADMLRNVPNFLRGVIRSIDLHLIGLADAVIIADESRREQIKGSKPKELVVIYNSPSIQINQIRNPIKTDYDLIIGYVGLLQKERGLLEVINVTKKHINWKLILAGFGGDSELIHDYGKNTPNVEFLGRVSYEKALEIYSGCDILFAIYDPSIPNHKYSSANKLFEAMMLGKPIIVAKNTGMDELVDRYKLGFIINYGNEKEIEEALRKVEGWDLTRKQNFATHAKSIFEKFFSWEIMGNRLVGLYKKLCEEKC